MHIERISYKRTFNLGNFSSEVIGVDFILHQGESEIVALENAKKIVEEAHKKNYPNLVMSNEIIVEQVLTKDEITAGNLFEIEKCTTIEELRKLKLISKAGKKEFDAYQDKLKQLTNA